jgi:hypothetical protein
MEAPEKIYLEKVYPDNGVLPNGLNYNQSPNDIEYIRADVFIKKACEWLEKNVAEATGIDSYAITESFKQAIEK